MGTRDAARCVNPEQARRRIEELEGDLRRDHRYFAANAFRAFLDGKAKTLDEAFGVTSSKTRGRPPVRQRRDLEIVWKHVQFRLARKSKVRGAIGKFEQQLAKDYHLADASKIREIVRDAETELKVISYVIRRRLSESDHRDRRAREQRAKTRMRKIRQQVSKSGKQRLKEESGP